MKNLEFRAWINPDEKFKQLQSYPGMYPVTVIDFALGLCRVVRASVFCEYEFPLSITILLIFSDFYDDNKEKIFEGDILKITDEYGESENVDVRWIDGGLCVEYDFGDFDLATIGYAIENWKKSNSRIEVIGNIFQNLNLLGKE